MAERFATALCVGRSRKAGWCTINGALLAALTNGRKHKSNWLPARTPAGDAILFLGRIDNRSELRQALRTSADGDNGDAQLYGLCYSSFGETCDLRIIGEYAAIIWSPAHRSVRLSRSPIHAPALHIWQDRERVIIASLPHAIFATDEAKRQIDEQKIADTLYLNYAEGERGWFRGVRRLPLGARCHIDAEGMRTTRYYDPAKLPEIRLPRDEDYVAAADALFKQATRAALSGFSRPAVSLSGGYDSQAVAAYAVQAMPEVARLLALTAVPEPCWDGRTGERRFGDEREHVAALLRMYPAIDSEILDAAGLSFGHKLSSLFLMMGAPPRNAVNLHWVHELHAHARARNCDVLLTGAMGNVTFSFDGKGSLPTLLRQGRLMSLMREIQCMKVRHGSKLRASVSQALMPLLPDAVWHALRYCRTNGVRPEFPAWCGINPDWASEMRVEERARACGHEAVFRARPNTRAMRLAMLDGNGESGDIIQALEAISGIPRRDPTSYRPLFEFCFGIPDDQFLRHGQSRWLAKRLLKGKIPDMVLNEGRRGLQAADWHLRLGRERQDLQSELDELAKDPGMAARFDLPRLRAALAGWPAATPIEDRRALQTLRLALPRAIATARFIQYVEGRNT